MTNDEPMDPIQKAFYQRRNGQITLDDLRTVVESRVSELERDNQGWEDECRLFLAQRDAYKEALEDIADQSTHPHPKCPSAWAKGNRARKALGLTLCYRRRKHESEVDIKS